MGGRMNAHIYLVTNNLNGKQYVGQTVENRKVGHGILINQAYKKYGKENFTYVKICNEITDRPTLNCLEKFWIAVIGSRSPNGYNIEEGGSDKGEIAESTRQKLRDSNLGKVMPEEVKIKISNSLKGDKNHFYGKTHTLETRQKIIAANVGKVVVHSEAAKEKIRQSKLGNKNPMYGKPITEEHRQKLKDNAPRVKYWAGKQFSAEHLAKLSIESTCPHCNKIGRGSAMKRHHMDNCKKAKVQ